MIKLIRNIVLIIALASPSYAMAAVTTVLVQAVVTDWTDLGAGPFLAVESGEANNLFAIADVKPGLTPTFGFRINSDFGPWSSATASHLWVIGIGGVIVSK